MPDTELDFTPKTDQEREFARKWADRALGVQNACNLSGVVLDFARFMEEIGQFRFEPGRGTDWVNQHPVAVLFAEQIHFLSGSSKRYHEAYQWCQQHQR